MKKVKFITVLMIILSVFLISCDGEPDLEYPIMTTLHSSNLESGARSSKAALGDPVLTNISGKMNAVLFPVDGEPYAYTVFTANEERGPVALEGCLFDDFNLREPVEWSHNAGDLQGPGGDSSSISFFGKYYDFTFTVDTVEHTVRVCGGDVDSYKKGDLLIKDSGVFKWYDSDTTTLVPETETRPSNVKQLDELAAKDFQGDMILVSMSIPIENEDGSSTVYVDETISAIDIDLDLSTFTVTVGDTNTAESIIQNFYVDLFKDPHLRSDSAAAKVAFENNNELSDEDEDDEE